ncbi:MAG: glycosyl hydrolase family 8 [Cytophagaceae bacterium]
MIKKANILILLFLVNPFLGHLLQSQNFPWPQNVQYDFGFKPTAETQAQMTTRADNLYNAWKSEFVVPANGGAYRVMYPQSSNFIYSASEGVGYGMLLSAYRADKDLFDGLFRFYSNHKNAQGVMAWQVFVNETCSDGCYSATDGDEDIAFALLVAHCQWGSDGDINYKQEAIDLINNIMQWDVDHASGRLRPGEFFGGPHCVDPSYFTMAYYPFFRDVTEDMRWDQVIEYCTNYFNSCGHTTSGLFRDWSTDDCGPAQAGTGPVGNADDCSWRERNYAFDASRIPWRLATDYLWFGTDMSKEVTNKMVSWARTSPPINGNVNNFRACLNWDGSGTCLTYNNVPIPGGMAVGAMTLDPTVPANLTWANSLYTNLNNLYSDDYFFNRTLQVLYMFTISGNFWKPECGLLPVDILSFKVGKKDHYREAVWHVANEVNLNYYILESSTDGSEFTLVDSIRANGAPVYKAKDYSSLYSKKLFYRLKNVDYDGGESVSGMVEFNNDVVLKPFLVSGNPIKSGEDIVLGNLAFDSEISVTDIHGKLFHTKIDTSSEVKIKIATDGLKNGVYFIRVLSQGELVTFKILII